MSHGYLGSYTPRQRNGLDLQLSKGFINNAFAHVSPFKYGHNTVLLLLPGRLVSLPHDLIYRRGFANCLQVETENFCQGGGRIGVMTVANK